MSSRHFSESLIQASLKWLHSDLQDAAHDIDHIQRVVAAAIKLGKAEGANLDVLIPAAYLHDCVSVDKRDSRRSQASTLSADAAIEWLQQHDYPSELLPEIHHAIASHSWSAKIETKT
ncbi:MAG: hypothetical protein KAG70_04425, partial [Alcanivorax sp.]|nr:hypothetical protein [Alcanivorax sp.]